VLGLCGFHVALHAAFGKVALCGHVVMEGGRCLANGKVGNRGVLLGGVSISTVSSLPVKPNVPLNQATHRQNAPPGLAPGHHYDYAPPDTPPDARPNAPPPPSSAAKADSRSFLL